MPPTQQATALSSNRLAMLPPGSRPPRIGAEATSVEYLQEARIQLLAGDPGEAERDLEWVQLSERADAYYAGCTIPALDPHCLGPICKALYGIGMGDSTGALGYIQAELKMQSHYLNGEPHCAPLDRQVATPGVPGGGVVPVSGH